MYSRGLEGPSRGDRLEECMVFVFDYDGVIVSEGEPRSLGVEALREALSIGGRVYLVTGRRERNVHAIRSLLRSLAIPHQRIAGVITRGKGSEVSHKLEAYREISDHEGCIGEIHDDNPEALWPARRLVSRGLILHYDNYCEAIYGYSMLRACRERHGSRVELPEYP
jgi:hypothetical protein